MQLLIKLLHRNSNLNEYSAPQSTRKSQQEIWMPRFSHSFERQNLPELQQSRRRVTQSQKVDSDTFRDSKALRLASNSTDKGKTKFPYRFAVASSAMNSLNCLHLGLVANKSQRVVTISFCLEENSKKRIFSRRKNFFALKKESSVKSTTSRVGAQEFGKNKIIKSKVLKLVDKNWNAKTQEMDRLASKSGNDQL